jgi:GNAT superfamily N-acetyltransferase
MLQIRPATIQDAALLRTMIRELAEYERELDRVTIREEDLARDGFGDTPRFRALIAEWKGQAAGYAVIFGYYSTWAGPGLFLEDLFVREAFRGRGNRKGAACRSSTHRCRRKMLRNPLGSARLE